MAEGRAGTGKQLRASTPESVRALCHDLHCVMGAFLNPTLTLSRLYTKNDARNDPSEVSDSSKEMNTYTLSTWYQPRLIGFGFTKQGFFV